MNAQRPDDSGDAPDLWRPGRRAWLEAAGLGALALALPRAAQAAEPPQDEDTPPPPADDLGDASASPSPTSPPRILVIGDSMIAGALGLFLARGLRDLHGYDVHRRGKSSSGLARPDFFNWTKEATRLLEKEFPDPDAVVMMVGGNDAQGLRMPKKTWIRWHEPGWSEEYARRVAAFAEHVAPNGRHLFWIGMPVMRPPKFHERMKRVNTIYRAEMAIRPNAHFIDIWRVLADEEGNYADRLKLHGGKKVRVRVGDGIHLSGAGARHAEAHIRAIIHRTLLAAGVTAARAPA